MPVRDADPARAHEGAFVSPRAADATRTSRVVADSARASRTGQPPDGLTVRRAGIADAAAIAHVHVTSWREAYGHVFSARLLGRLDEVRRAERWRVVIASPTQVWVAERDGSIVAWASVGRGREADVPAPCELEGIYSLRSAYGSGAAQRVLDAALRGSAAYLWVLTDNPRAQAFYRRNGFVADGGTKRDTFGGEPADEIRMVRTAP